MSDFRHEAFVSNLFKEFLFTNFSFIHRLLSLYCLITLVSIKIDATTTENNAKVNCYIRHLKSKEKLDADYPERADAGEGEDCDRLIKRTEKDLYKFSAQSSRRRSDFRKYTKCMTTVLRAEGWVDDVILQAVYRDNESLSIVEKQQKVAELDERISRAAEEAFSKCVFEKKFEELFDRLSKASKDSSSDSSSSSEENTSSDNIDDYCGRKYIVDNNLVNQTVVLNPKNINMDDVDCDARLKEKFAIFDAMLRAKLNDENLELNEQQVKCALTKYREAKFGDQFLAAAFIGSKKVNSAQRSFEKKRFVKFMFDIFKSTDACIVS